MTQKTMKEMILDSIKANESFVDSVGAEIEDPLWIIFGEAVIAIQGLSPVLDSDDEDEHTLLLMCCNALSDSFAALMSIRQGFVRPPAIIMRGVVENLAAVVTFTADEAAFKKFKEDKYDLPKAVGPSKAHFPELAQHYGVLTNQFTHETVESVGRSLGNGKGIFFVPKLEGDDLSMGQTLLLLTVAMIVHNIGQIAEFCFIRYLPNPTLWERVDAQQLRTRSTEGRRLIKVIGDKLEARMKKPGP